MSLVGAQKGICRHRSEGPNKGKNIIHVISLAEHSRSRSLGDEARTDRIVSRVIACLLASLVFALLPFPHAEHSQPPPPPPSPRCSWGVMYMDLYILGIYVHPRVTVVVLLPPTDLDANIKERLVFILMFE